MIIVADENIPYIQDAFAPLGQVRAMGGRAITAEAVRDADCLLVRSVTAVNRGLLEGSKVQFVATATSGFDHVDTAYLQSAGIGFAYAPGSNAVSVAEWVVAALLRHAASGKVRLAGKSVAVVGVGHVGSQVARRMEPLGLRVVLHDPPLREATGDEGYRPLDEALACDFITLHTPLTREEPHATFHLAGAEFFAAMKPGAVFINAARGAVADTAALTRALSSGHLGAALLDVWENEPLADVELLRMTQLATPHIAGYSLDGKVLGAQMIHGAACRHFGWEPRFDWGRVLPPPAHSRIRCDQKHQTFEETLWGVVRAVYDVGADDARYRETIELPESADRSAAFTRLRKEYPVRREFCHYGVAGEGLTHEASQSLSALGFALAGS